MVISIFLNYQQQQISVYSQQVVNVSRRSDGGKSTKMSFKNVRYGSQKTVSNHLNIFLLLYKHNEFSFVPPVHSLKGYIYFCPKKTIKEISSSRESEHASNCEIFVSTN